MRKALVFLVFAIIYSGKCYADEASARTVMKRMGDVYLRAKSAHILVEREDHVTANGASGSKSTEIEITESGRTNYIVRTKSAGVEAVEISNGETTWKALPKEKRWSKIEAALSGEEEEETPADSKDLRSFAVISTVGQFIAVAMKGQNFLFDKDDEVKVGGVKYPCYVIHAATPNAQFQLWVDKQRFYVLQSREKMLLQKGAVAEIVIKTKSIELNADLPESTFKLEPAKGWTEAEMLVLPGEQRALLVGARAAKFSLRSLEGSTLSLDQTRGKVVVLDFWATWCPPCRAELPSIEKLRNEFSDRVEFIGINDEDSGKVKSFVTKNKYEMTVLMDSKRDVHRQYGVRAIPTLLVIDSQGVIRTHFIGQRSEATLRAAIESAMSSK